MCAVVLIFIFSHSKTTKDGEVNPTPINPNGYLYLHDTTLASFIYWKLSIADLTGFMSGVHRTTEFALLKHAIATLPDSEVRTTIERYAYLDNPEPIVSKACLMIIKHNFVAIMKAMDDKKKVKSTCEAELKRGEELCVLGKQLWNKLMFDFKLHHYLCPHTQALIFKSIKAAKIHLKNEYRDLLNQNKTVNDNIKLSVEEVKQLYCNLKNQHLITITDWTKIKNRASHVVSDIVRNFAMYLLDTGIANDNSTKTTTICKAHVEGYVKRFVTLSTPNNMDLGSEFVGKSKLIKVYVEQTVAKYKPKANISVDLASKYFYWL